MDIPIFSRKENKASMPLSFQFFSKSSHKNALRVFNHCEILSQKLRSYFYIKNLQN